MVLPVGRRSVRPANGAVALPGETGVAPRRRPAAAPSADEVLGLVVPDRHVGAGAENEPAGKPRLPFGPRSGARVLQIPRASAPAPFGTEVPIQVDAAAVHTETEPPARPDSGCGRSTDRARGCAPRASRLVISMPSHSLPWMQPTTRIASWARDVAVAVHANRPPARSARARRATPEGLHRRRRGQERGG